MKLNDKGIKLYDKWTSIYDDELERIRKEKNDAGYVEGFCIIDNNKFIKTVEDFIGLYIHGYYEDFIDIFINEWKTSGDAICCFGLSYDEVESEIRKYYV